MNRGCELDAGSLDEALKDNGVASYKIPTRFIAVPEFPRIGGNKVDKTALLQSAMPARS